MIPPKLFMRMTDLEEEFLDSNTKESFIRSTNFQDEIGWPFKANLEQLKYWEGINRERK